MAEKEEDDGLCRCLLACCNGWAGLRGLGSCAESVNSDW